MKPDTPNRPLKRNAGLIQFSREHHFSLLLVWKIRHGIQNQIAAERIASYIIYFYEHDLQKHFEAEELELFPKLGKENVLQQRALYEHEAMCQLIDEIRNDTNNNKLLEKFADTLEKHIRFEERTLFDVLQNTLTEQELIALEKAHSAKPHDVSETWEDKFWNRESFKQ